MIICLMMMGITSNFFNTLFAKNFTFCEPSIDAVNITDPSDCGVNDGSLEIVSSGGTGTFEYTINGGVNWQEQNIFLDIPAGAYGVGVRNADGSCPFFYPFQVELMGPDSPRFIEVAATDPTDCGVDDGVVVITAEGGTGPYFYSVDGGISWGASNIFTDLPPGIYTAMVKNADGTCPTAYVIPIELEGPVMPVLLNVNGIAPSDCDLENGSIFIEATGQGLLSYSIDQGNTWQASPFFLNLAEGSYHPMIKNAEGTCLLEGEPLMLTGPSSPEILSIEGTHPTDCLLADGQITVQAAGTSFGLVYTIDGGLTWQSEEVFLNLMAGTYEILVRNADGTCPAVEGGSLMLFDPPKPEFSGLEGTDPSDCLAANGSINVLATGGFGMLEYSIDGGLSWQNASFFESLPAGNYLPRLRNQDGTCLVTSVPIDLVDPPMPVIDYVDITDPSDCGTLDGSLQILVSGGTGSFEYSINSGYSWQSSALFSALGAGTFFTAVRNQNGTCESYAPSGSTLSDPEAPVILGTEFLLPAVCGSADGHIKIWASSNSALIEYSINNGITWQAANSFSGLGEGVYSIAVRNLDGTCFTTGESLVFEGFQPPAIQEIVALDPTDCGASDGQIYILAEAGNYEFSVNNGISWQSNGFYQNLTAGQYHLLVRQVEGGCFVDLGNITLDAPPQANIQNIQATAPSDCVLEDGTITVLLENGAGNFQYSINNGGTWQGNGFFDHLSSGVYNIFVRNPDETCLVTGGMVELTGPELPQIENVAVIPPSDCDQWDGQIKIVFTHPENSFLVSIDNGESWQAESNFSQLGAGVYSIWISNQSGTCSEAWGSIEMITPEQPVISEIIQTDFSDCEPGTGTIEVLMEHSGDYEFSINGGTSWQAEGFFPGLNAGSYVPMVRNASGTCLVMAVAIEIQDPFSELEVGFVTSNPSDCGAADGKIEWIVEGPGGPFEYSIDGGATWFAEPFFVGLTEGSYPGLLRLQEGGCTKEVGTIELEGPEAPVIVQISSQDPAECNASNGTITILAQGNFGDFQYSINGGTTWQHESTFSALAEGNYGLAIRNADGTCEVLNSEWVHLAGPQLPQIENIVVTPISDCGLTDGNILFEGEAVEYYEFSINGGQSWQAFSVFGMLAEGYYPVQVRGADTTCVLEYGTVEITSPSSPEIDSIITHPVSDCWTQDGSLTIVPVNPESTSEYSIDGGVTWTNDPFFDQLPPGEAIVWSRNEDGTCAYVERPVTIKGFTPPQIMDVLTENPQNCEATDGRLTIIAEAADVPYEYSINGGLDWSNSYDFQHLTEDIYTIKVRIPGEQCEVTYQQLLVLTPVAPLDVEILEFSEPLCFGEANGIIHVQAIGGIPPYNYFWSHGETSPELNELKAGIYELSVFDARGCMEVFRFKMKQPEPFQISLGTDIDTTICLGQSVSYHFEAGNDHYQWGSENGFVSSDPSVIFNEAGLYWLTVENESGCTASDTIQVIYRDAFFDADFLLPEEGVINTPIVMIDISWPVPDSISWFFDEEHVALQQSDEDQQVVLMENPGTYVFGMKAHSGECYGLLEKEITIFSSPEELTHDFSQQNPSNVLEFHLSPNPNNGTFQASILLEQPQQAELWVIDQNGYQFDHRVLGSDYYFQESFHFGGLQPGVYTVVLQTDTAWQYINFVVQ